MSKFDSKFNLMEDTINRIATPGNLELGLTDEEERKSLEVINSVLAGLTEAPSLNPYYMVQKIKERLNLALGLTFDTVYFNGVSGEKTLPLVQLDSKTVHNTSGGFTVDNGFLKRFPFGLQIRFNFLKTHNLYHVNAEIQQAPKPSPTVVHEKKEQ